MPALLVAKTPKFDVRRLLSVLCDYWAEYHNFPLNCPWRGQFRVVRCAETGLKYLQAQM